MPETAPRSADDFFKGPYRDYALYTIQNRAIPSEIDGFKPSQRKIAFAAYELWKKPGAKALKVFQLGGQAAAMSYYHHGSLDQTIIGMAQGFKNSLPIFQGIGQFGSLRSPQAGAPRYIGVKFSDNFTLLYKDFDLTDPQYEEGVQIEPKFYLPVIPTVLLNGGSGIAVGFSTNILNRHPVSLTDACIDILTQGTTSVELSPWYSDFHGTVEPYGDTGRSWVFKGIVERVNTSTVAIHEIPPGYTYESYEKVLDDLIEKGVLVSYEDNSSGRVSYVLKFRRRDLAKYKTEASLLRLLKLTEKATENLTTLDIENNPKVFSNPMELVKHFVEFRKGYYVLRKERLLAKIDDDIKVLTNRVRFITMVASGDLEVSNRKKADIEKSLRDEGFDKVRKSYDYLLSMPIYSLTMEKSSELSKSLSSKLSEREALEKTSPIRMYLDDLKDLRKQLVRQVGEPSSKSTAQPKARTMPKEKARTRTRKPRAASKAVPSGKALPAKSTPTEGRVAPLKKAKPDRPRRAPPKPDDEEIESLF